MSRVAVTGRKGLPYVIDVLSPFGEHSGDKLIHSFDALLPPDGRNWGAAESRAAGAGT